MNFIKMNKYHFLLVVVVFIVNTAFSQNEKQQKMELLNFMVGEWIGASKIYEDGTVTRQGPAYQKISYDLDKTILVIELNSELLQLHTIIYYDEKDATFYYYPFSKRGVSRYPAEYRDGRLIVSSSENKRFIFSRTPDGGFREYGEELVDGKWTQYFEDIFKNSQ